MAAEHIAQTRALCDQCAGENLYSEASLAALAADPAAQSLVLLDDSGRVVGYLMFCVWDAAAIRRACREQADALDRLAPFAENTYVRFLSIGVAPALRHRGLSRWMTGVMLEEAKQRFGADVVVSAYWVRSGHIPMEANIRRFGFTFVGEVKDFWWDREDLVCPECGGRCHCPAAIYIRLVGRD